MSKIIIILLFIIIIFLILCKHVPTNQLITQESIPVKSIVEEDNNSALDLPKIDKPKTKSTAINMVANMPIF